MLEKTGAEAFEIRQRRDLLSRSYDGLVIPG